MYLILPVAIRHTACCILICFVSIRCMIIIVVSPSVIISIIIPLHGGNIPILFVTLPIEIFLIGVYNRLHHDRLPEVLLILVVSFIAIRFELLRVLLSCI